MNDVDSSSPSGRDYVTGATDYLRQKGLLVDAPYEVPSLAPLQRLAAAPPSVFPQSYYRVAGEKVFCHLCGGHRHYLGMVGLCPDGSAILFGSACAKDYFGPDIWRKMEAMQDLAVERANEEFRGQWIKRDIVRAMAWLDTNLALLRGVISAWTELFYNHSDMTKELLDALGQNRGRLIETRYESASYAARQAGVSGRAFSVSEIVVSLPAWEGIAAIGQVEAHIASIRYLCDSVASVSEPTVEDFSRWDNYLSTKVRAGAANVDHFLEFSVALFAHGVLEKCGEWLDRRRTERLSDQSSIIPRNAGDLLRRRVGYGFEMPPSLLAEALPDFSLGRTIGRNAVRLLVG